MLLKVLVAIQNVHQAVWRQQKVSKLTKANATLRLQVKQLENFKSKIQRKKQQQVDDQQEIDNLLAATTRTNSQIFDQSALSKLNQMRKKSNG